MNSLTIRRATKKDGKGFLSLIKALADFEKLKPPTFAARKRLLHDAFGKKKRFDTLLAEIHGKAIGYAIFFETYSSFLALPTLYLEDIFVLPEYRKQKIGFQLFRECVAQAKRRGCGRMEWMVLDWNRNAIGFYDSLGTTSLREWLPYRLEHSNFQRILNM